MCPSVLSITCEGQVGDGPVVLADCVLDQACGFLTVSMVGSEASCDLYAWTSENFACTASGQVSPGRHAAPVPLVHPSDTQMESTPGYLVME